MMFRNLFVALIIIASIGQVKAQLRGSCGMTTEDLQTVAARLVRNKAAIASGEYLSARGGVSYVPVTFHLLANDDGSGRALESDILDMVCQINALYQDQNIQYYIKSLNYINNTTTYTDPLGFVGSNTLAKNKVTDAMNVYISLNITTHSGGTTQPGTILGIFYPTLDALLIIKDQANGSNASTGAHEFGHFFSMLHTFYGWEQGGYVAGKAAPFNSPGGIPTEFAARGAGKNCDSAGDKICDTPPDYNFGFGNNGCSYMLTALDPNGVQVHPDSSNLMGYFIGCENTFSALQKQAIAADLATNPTRAYVRSSFVPDLTEIAPPALAAPSEASTIPYSDAVSLSWNTIPGATSYIVELSRSKTFTLTPLRIVTKQTSLTINNLSNPGVLFGSKGYYWHVKAYSAYKTCAGYSSIGSFTTGTVSGTADIAGLNALEIMPNPVAKSQQLGVRVSAGDAIRGTLKLYNGLGQLVVSQSVEFSSGSSVQYLSTDGLSGGLYLLSLESGRGVISKKVVIMDN